MSVERSGVRREFLVRGSKKLIYEAGQLVLWFDPVGQTLNGRRKKEKKTCQLVTLDTSGLR